MGEIELGGPIGAQVEVEPAFHLPHGVGVHRAARRQTAVRVPAGHPVTLAGRADKSGSVVTVVPVNAAPQGPKALKLPAMQNVVGRLFNSAANSTGTGCWAPVTPSGGSRVRVGRAGRIGDGGGDDRRIVVVERRKKRAIRGRVVLDHAFPAEDRVRAEQQRLGFAFRQRRARKERDSIGEVVLAGSEKRIALLRSAHERLRVVPLQARSWAGIAGNRGVEGREGKTLSRSQGEIRKPGPTVLHEHAAVRVEVELTEEMPRGIEHFGAGGRRRRPR